MAKIESAVGKAAGGPVLAAAKGTKNLGAAAGGVVGATAAKAGNISPTQFGKVGGALGGVAGAAVRGGALGALATPPGRALAVGAGAAYGASQTPGGKSIIKGAVKGAGGPNNGLGVLGAPLGAAKGAMNSQGFSNVASGAAKGGLIGAIGGPVGSIVGAGIGAIGGLFSNRGMNKGSSGKGGAGAPVMEPPKSSGGASGKGAGGQYTIKRGDNLYNVAKAHGTTLDAVRKANPKMMANPKYKNGSMVWAGTKVNLPGGANTPSTSTATKVPNRATPQPQAIANISGGGGSNTMQAQ